MLVVTVELWPGGEIAHAKEIASVQIANVSDLAEVSNYLVNAQEEGEPRLGIPPTKVVLSVEGHPRRQSVFNLLKTVFNRLGDK